MQTRSVSFFLIFNLLAIFAYAQNDGPQETTKSLYLNGKVRSLTTITYSIRMNYDKTLVEKEQYGYRTTFYKNGFVDSTFSRNYFNNYIFQMDYHYFWKQDTLTSTVHKQNAWGKTVFNKDNLPIYSYFYHEKAIQPISERLFEYDKEGKLTAINRKVQGLNARDEYYYRKNGTTYIVTQSGNSPMDYYEINSALRKTLDVSYSYSNTLGGDVRSEVKYFYDSYNNLVREERTSYLKTGDNWKILDGASKEEYQYVYDAHNNWVERKRLSNGQATEVVKRTIIYW